MKAVTSFGDVQLRRLSTKSAVLPTDHALSTQWIWYWMDESNIWKEYEPLVCQSDKQHSLMQRPGGGGKGVAMC